MGEHQLDNEPVEPSTHVGADSLPVDSTPPPSPSSSPSPSTPSDPSTASSKADEFLTNKLKSVGMPTDLAGKLIGVFAVTLGLSIFLWLMCGAGFPWFIYVVYSVAFIDCIIYGVKTKNSFFVNWTIYATTNVMLFLTFLACGGGYPWFIFPAFSMAILPVSQYLYKKYETPSIRWLYISGAIYLLINSMLFFTWMINSLHNSYPWFIYPVCGWGVVILIQYNHAVMHNKSRLLLLIVADIGIMLMITFRFALGPVFMVFVFLGLLIIILYFILLKRGYTMHCWLMKKKGQQEPATAPQNPDEASSSAPPPSHVINVNPNSNVVPTSYQYPYPAPYQTSPPGAMYFQPNVSHGPVYYAYFPSPNGQLYPTITTMPASPVAPAASPAPTPSAAVPVPPAVRTSNDAILTSDVEVERDSKGKGKARDDEEEDGYLLRNSPTRSYSNDK